MRELGLGMSGADVKRWERFLVRAQALESMPSSFFGPEVATATKAFQKAFDLETTGRADASTLGQALQQGLLDHELDEPAEVGNPGGSKESRWNGVGPLMVAIAAAVGSFVTSVGVEFIKHRNTITAEQTKHESGLAAERLRQHAAIEAERERLRSLLIQQALRVETSAGSVSWRNNEAQWEVVSRFRGYVRLGLISMQPEILEAFERDVSSVPVARMTGLVASATPSASDAVTESTPTPAVPPVRSGQTTITPPPVVRTQRVFVQFAGSIGRDQIIRMARELSGEWRVEGADRGGERVASADGLRQVRWGHPDDEEAAKALADAVERTRVVQGQVTADRVPTIRRGTLELWISP